MVSYKVFKTKNKSHLAFELGIKSTITQLQKVNM